MIVTPAGSKTYIVEYRPGFGGRVTQKRRYTIGRHGCPWTPDTARAEAKRILSLVAAGRDPAAEKNCGRINAGDTLIEVVPVYIEKYAKVKQKSWPKTLRSFNCDILPYIGKKNVSDITRQDIVYFLDVVSIRSNSMANQALAFLRKFFNWCIERGIVNISPCTRIKPPGPIRARERVLSDGELAEVWRAADSIGGRRNAVIKLLILTAQRRDEIVYMRWSEIDFFKSTLNLPGVRTKNKRAHEVPLVATALSLIKSMPRISGGHLVFSYNGETPMSGLSACKARIDALIARAREEAGIIEPMPGWTFHDIRRTATTGMARLGIPPHIADAILNHKTGSIQGVAATYNRFGYQEERRRALEAWEQYVLTRVVGDGTALNIVDI